MDFQTIADDAAASAAASSREIDMRLASSEAPLHQLITQTAVEARYAAREAREDVALALVEENRRAAAIYATISCLNAAFARVMVGLVTAFDMKEKPAEAPEPAQPATFVWDDGDEPEDEEP